MKSNVVFVMPVPAVGQEASVARIGLAQPAAYVAPVTHSTT
jgi:hypothetical protein